MIGLEYQLVILSVVGMMAVIALVNLATLRSLRQEDMPGSFPKVSVLLPFRNEAAHIRTCLSRLADQHYPDFEVIVLDDNSEDLTASLAEEVAGGNQRIRVLRGKLLPSGWTGKTFACHQLSELAAGEILLFTDAGPRTTATKLSLV